MLHIQVPVCLTLHLHVSMLCACSKKRLLCCLCSCTLCEEIHAQVTSQRGSGAPGKREASHRWRYPLVRSIQVEATGSPVCFTQVKATGASPVYFALVKRTGRRNSRGSIQG